MFENNLKYWKDKKELIKDNYNAKKNKVLIEIAAQHPLVEGKKPGNEFEARLRRAIEIYKEEIKNGNEVIFYVPGSVHSITKDGEKIEDLISLSEAGKNFLIENGINPNIIFGNNSNVKYKGNKGVYNSGDECYVSSQIYNDENCNRLLSIVSPVQVFRKGMFYNEFGIKPEIYSVPLDNTFHNYIGELFWSLYVTTFMDHNWQGDKSFLSVLTRVERCMNYKCNPQEKETLNNKIIIPKDIMKIKEFLMEQYNKAKHNMQKNEQNDTILIKILSSENIDSEISQAVELCKKQKNRKIVVTLDNKKDAISFYSKIQGEDINNINIKVIKNAEKEFLENRYRSLYCICPSDQVMKTAVNSIYKGVISLIVTVPTEKDDYIKETFELYNKIIGKELIDLSDNSDIATVSKNDIIRGLLMDEIDVENLPDVPSYEWVSNITDGECL